MSIKARVETILKKVFPKLTDDKKRIYKSLNLSTKWAQRSKDEFGVNSKKASFGTKKTIIEVFKKNRVENINFEDKDDLQYKIDKNNILRFY